jgi:hypothetical protein
LRQCQGRSRSRAALHGCGLLRAACRLRAMTACIACCLHPACCMGLRCWMAVLVVRTAVHGTPGRRRPTHRMHSRESVLLRASECIGPMHGACACVACCADSCCCGERMFRNPKQVRSEVLLMQMCFDAHCLADSLDRSSRTTVLRNLTAGAAKSGIFSMPPCWKSLSGAAGIQNLCLIWLLAGIQRPPFEQLNPEMLSFPT